MLYESDAAIVRRDPALPGLATLLDPVAFGDALRHAAPGVMLESLTPVFTRYNPGTSCLISYRCRVNGGDINVHAKAYPVSAVGKLQKARERPGVAGLLGAGRLTLDEIATVVSIYPNDDRVKALSLLADDASHAQVLRELLPQHPKLWQGTLRHLKYKPERRAVLRLDSGGEPQAVLKLYTAGGYETARQVNQRFTSRGALQLAPDIGHSDQHQILAFGWLPGRQLSDAIRDPSFAASGLEPVGAALAELHAQDATGLPRQTGADATAALLAAADKWGVLVPAIAPRAHALAQRLAARMADTAVYDHPVHGDFKDEQVLLNGDTAVILDLDQAKQGDPVADLGMFIAYLERNVIRGEFTAERLGALKEGLLEGYAAVSSRPIAAHLDVHVAALLLRRLVPQFFRFREPDWPARVEETVVRAGAILAGAT